MTSMLEKSVSDSQNLLARSWTSLVKVTNMRRELQSQNRVDGDYEKTTGPIYPKF
jgi:hypothetical protein